MDGIHESYKMMGDGLIRPTKGELINKQEFQRVLVASRDIREGDIFKLENLMLSRVAGGKGLPPSFMDRIIGSRSNREYKKNEPIFI